MKYYPLEFMKNQVGSCAFYLVIAPRYFVEHNTFKQKIKEFKSDCWFYG